MSKLANQTPQPDPTAWVQLEDQSLATNKAAVAIPLSVGETKTTFRWLTPIYGQRVVQQKSGGKKSGGSGTSLYYGTIAGSCGVGPAWSVEWIVINGIQAFTTSLQRPTGADYSDITLQVFGKCRIMWGTETQIANPLLVQYQGDTTAFRGQVVLIFEDICFGQNGESNAPTVEVGWRRLPNQTIITGTSAANDGAYTANAIAIAAELLTSWDWVGLDPSKLDSTSFQATADALQALRASGTDPNRSAVAVAPLWDTQTDLKSAFATICAVSKAWFRTGKTGLIEAGYWRRDGSLTNVSALTINDLSEIPKITAGDITKLPNSFVVEFSDATKHHKTNCITLNNTAALQVPGATLRRQTAQRPELILDELARVVGAELLLENAFPPVNITLSVRRSRAVNVDGTAIRPGDYVTYPVQILPSEPADVRLFRVMRREFDPTGPITLFAELETNAGLQAVVPVTVVSNIAPVTPPVFYQRVLAVNPDTTDALPPVVALAARPSDLAAGFNLTYSKTSGGDFQSLGTQAAFALPLSLVQAVGATDASVRVALLADTADGVKAQRDSSLLLNWQGSDIEGRDDQLLLILVSKTSGGVVSSFEILSVDGPATVVSGSTFDVPVLRGRRGTTAQAFTGSFPEVWTYFEAWVIPHASLVEMTHADFLGQFGVSVPVYFGFIPYDRTGTYDGPDAYVEHQRRSAGSFPQQEFINQTSSAAEPIASYIFPAAQLPPVYSGSFGYIAYAFKRSVTAPTTPTGGTYISPIPSGWSAGNPSGTDPLWQSVRRFTPNGIGQDPTWSAPVRLEGVDGAPGATGNTTERRYHASALVPSTPTGDNPTGWTAAMPSSGGTTAIWAVDGVKDLSGHLVGSWSTPQRVSGNIILYTSGAPSGYTLLTGDTYFDISDGNKIYRYNGSSWVAAFQPFLATDASGHITGLVVAGTAGQPFQVVCSDFQIYNGTTNDVPFEIVSGVTRIKNAMIQTLGAGQITAGTVDVELALGTLGSLSSGSGANSFYNDHNGTVFGDPSGFNLKVQSYGGQVQLGVCNGGTTLATFGAVAFGGGTNAAVLDMGGGGSSAIQNCNLVGGTNVHAFGTTDPRTIDAPLVTLGGAFVTKSLDVGGVCAVVGAITGASLSVGGGEISCGGNVGSSGGISYNGSNKIGFYWDGTNVRPVVDGSLQGTIPNP